MVLQMYKIRLFNKCQLVTFVITYVKLLILLTKLNPIYILSTVELLIYGCRLYYVKKYKK